MFDNQWLSYRLSLFSLKKKDYSRAFYISLLISATYLFYTKVLVTLLPEFYNNVDMANTYLATSGLIKIDLGYFPIIAAWTTVIVVIFCAFIFISDFFKELRKISILETETVMQGKPLSKNIALRKMYLKFSILFGVIAILAAAIYWILPATITVMSFIQPVLSVYAWYVQLGILAMAASFVWFLYLLLVSYIKNILYYEKHVLYLDIDHNATIPEEETFED